MNHTESDTTLLDTQLVTQQTHAESTQPPDIATLIEQLCSSIDSRTHTNDRDILCFCLHQLFLGIDALSRVACRTFTEQVFAAESQSASIWHLRQQRTTWTYLQDIKYILERIEPLCQLLNDATSAILIFLDTSSSESTERTETILTVSDVSFVIHLYCEQFQDALTPILDTWQQCLAQQHTFRYRFAHLFSATPTLIQLDNAFSTLFKNVGSLFRDTLPALSIAEKEEISAQFLDLMQKIDQVLEHIEAMRGPLHTLIKQFALKSEMH